MLVKMLLNRFMPVASLYNPWKHQKTSGFLMFPGGIEMEHLREIG